MVCLITYELLLENKLFDMFRKVVRPDGPELPSSVEVLFSVLFRVARVASCLVLLAVMCAYSDAWFSEQQREYY